MGKNLKGKELGKNIIQRKDGRYQGRYIDRFGKRKSVYGETLNDVRKLLRDKEYENSRNLNSSDETITVNQWYSVWRDTFKVNKCRNTTLESYDRTFRLKISPEIGDMKMIKVLPIHLQRIINKADAKGTRELIRAVLTNLFKYAVASEIVAKNPALNLDIRRIDDEDSEATFLTDDEIQIIMKYSENSCIKNIYRLILQTGMRIGEITGLTWDNIDYEKNVIHVVQQLVTTKDPKTKKWVLEVHKPKSKAGIRDIPMTKETKEILRELREDKDVIKFPKNSGFVFATRNNTPQYRASISKLSDRIRDKIRQDYPDFKNFSPHSFRHTFATKMIAAGVKPKVLQKIIGHNQIQTTMDLYCHVYDDQIYEAMDTFENMA